MTIERTAGELAELVDGEVVGDGAVGISGVAGIASARPEALVFAEDEASLAAALASEAGAVVAGKDARGDGGKTLIRTGNPRLAFARIAALLHPEPRPPAGVHPTAVVDETAVLGIEVFVGARAVVEAGAVIGDRSVIGPGVVVGAGVRIGADARLHPNVTLYPGVRLGDRVVVHAGAVLGADGFGYVDTPEGKVKFPQLGTLLVEDDVEIGANAAIDRGALEATVIRRGSKIDNLVQIAHNVEIGRNCAISAQTGIAGTTRLGDGVVMGGQCGIGDHGVIGDGIVLGARSTLFTGKRLEGPGVYFGHPARPLREELKRMAAPGRVGRLTEQLGALEKRVEILEGEVT